jgi:hypothetical protein
MRLRMLIVSAVVVCLAATAFVPPAAADDASRDATRDKLRQLLVEAGKRSDVGTEFHQSTKQPYNFVGSMTTGLANAESLEIVISVTSSDTIGFRIYPHFNGGYINLDKAKNSAALMRQLLNYSDRNFLYWGADSTNDVFCGYTFTLESGFPPEAVTIVLRSIRGTDRFVGELRPYIDGSAAGNSK